MNRKIIITGANGYLGKVISSHFKKRGYKVFELYHIGNRKLSLHTGDSTPFKLEANLNKRFFFDKDVLIHCAYDFRLNKWSDIRRVNVEGSINLLRIAYKAGIKKILFISTMSAHKDCKSLYGRAKLQIENVALQLGATVIRPGLIFGKNSGGVLGSLEKMVEKRTIIPDIMTGKNKLFLVHEQDLMSLIETIIRKNINTSNPIYAAAKRPMTLTQIIKKISITMKKKVIFIPMPWQLIWIILKISEILNININFRSDSLISLVNQNRIERFQDEKIYWDNYKDFNLDYSLEN